jgi:hypothetical protein
VVAKELTSQGEADEKAPPAGRLVEPGGSARVPEWVLTSAQTEARYHWKLRVEQKGQQELSTRIDYKTRPPLEGAFHKLDKT